MFRFKDKRSKRTTCVGALTLSLSSISKPKSEDHWFTKGRACLDVRRLEQLLTVDLEPFCPMTSLEEFHGLAERYHRDELTEASTTSHGQSLNGDTPELDHAYHFLRKFVDKTTSTSVPARILSQIHSFLGVLLDMKGDFDEAASFHMRAIWCAMRSPEHQGGNQAQQLAVSMCRLAASYGRQGDVKAKDRLLRQAEAVAARHLTLDF